MTTEEIPVEAITPVPMPPPVPAPKEETRRATCGCFAGLWIVR